MIELIDFSKSYNSKDYAVKNFFMTCKPGKITGLLGINGAGKTTILKAICARHYPTSGKILVNGIDSSLYPEKIKSVTGFVEEQNSSSFLQANDFTVYEYLLFFASLNCEKNRVFERLQTVKKDFSLEDVWSKKTGKLSQGFKKRVAFACALIHDPEVLVFDEPAGGLDPSQIIKVRQLIKSLKKTHTILLSTHLMQEVDALCDYIYIINKGIRAAFGTAESITKEQNCRNLEQAFLKITEESV